ncbi:MAG: pyridoxine 5'-phosphate synthase [Pseudomonadota bacterium]
MPTALSVNLNAIAYLRNRRDLPWPSVSGLAAIALDEGAAGVTVHPRPDERHTRRQDVFELADLVRARPGAEFNVEGYPTPDFLELVEEVRPDQVTLVPDDPAQATSDHGWDFQSHGDSLEGIVSRLKEARLRVSLFIDADEAAPEMAASTGTDRVELYTGPYGGSFDPERRAVELEKLARTAEAARACGLAVNAGHDLTLDNLPPLVRRIPFIDEVSIGHGLTADCLIYGMAQTVRLYCRACDGMELNKSPT